MPTFPTLSCNPSVPIIEKTRRSTIRSKMENGTVVTRPRWSSGKKRFELAYLYLDANDFGSLDYFFNTTVQGGATTFSWTHPQTNSAYTVRFAEDELPWETPTRTNLRNVKFKLEQV